MNALATIETLTPSAVFAPGGVEGIISKLEADVRAIERDITTEVGREAVRSLAYKVARSKTALDEMGKDLVANIKKQSSAIDAERRTIRERLDALRDEVRAPLTEWEDAEKERVSGHENALVFIIASPRDFGPAPTSQQIRARIAEVRSTCSRDWQEFHERAETASVDALAMLQTMLDTAEKTERDQAELAELRRLKAERDEMDRAATAASEAAERARVDAEQKAARDAEAAARAAERDRQRYEQAKRDQETAVARAIEQERQRTAAKDAAEKAATAKREANHRHRAKVHKEALDALVSAGLSGPEANELIVMISAGKIPHVSITY